MRLRGRIDNNQKELVKLLREHGYSVYVSSAAGKGFPDLIVGKDGKTWLAEIKFKKGVLTPDQVKFHQDWKGAPILVIRSPEEALSSLV